MKNLLHRLSRWTLMISLCAWASVTQAETQVSIGISVPGLSIGINTPQYPQFVRVPSYPVYYAPQQGANLFLYDGLYWAYQRDDWYSSSWYNGPWYAVGPQRVPLYLLRIPVRYYRDPPSYFRGGQQDAPPRWGEHWGNEWQQQRRGWDRWDRGGMPAPAPLPRYQRQYSGERYPKVEQQQDLHGRNYRYQPHDSAVRAQVREHSPQRGAEAHATGRPQVGKTTGRDKDREDGDAPNPQRKK